MQDSLQGLSVTQGPLDHHALLWPPQALHKQSAQVYMQAKHSLKISVLPCLTLMYRRANIMSIHGLKSRPIKNQ